MRKGLLIVISGASGTGKGTVCNRLLKEVPDMNYSISATTRQPREGEKDGVNYYFYTKEEFQKMVNEGGFLEWAEIYGNFYGTPLKKIEERLNLGEDILLEIDVQGALNVMKKYPQGVFIFLLPPSLQELEKRIRGRGTESGEVLAKRIAAAKDEISIGRKYTYTVVNDKVDKAVKKIKSILMAEHCITVDNLALYEELAK